MDAAGLLPLVAEGAAAPRREIHGGICPDPRGPSLLHGPAGGGSVHSSSLPVTRTRCRAWEEREGAAVTLDLVVARAGEERGVMPLVLFAVRGEVRSRVARLTAAQGRSSPPCRARIAREEPPPSLGREGTPPLGRDLVGRERAASAPPEAAWLLVGGDEDHPHRRSGGVVDVIPFARGEKQKELMFQGLA